VVYYYGFFPIHKSRLLLLSFHWTPLPDSWYTCQLTHRQFCFLFFNKTWIKKIADKSTEVYQKYFVEMLKKELLVYFHGYMKNDFKELRIMMKEISRRHGYLLINSVLKMLFKLSSCLEN